jgi:hypothetical protein
MSFPKASNLTSASLNSDIGSKLYLQTEPERSYYEKNGVSKFVKFHDSLLNDKYRRADSEGASRTDKFGNPILKEKKSHKISFADQVPSNGRTFLEINKVASYKRFNSAEEEVKGYCFSCLII